MSTDDDAQNDEMLALESIFGSDEFSFRKDNSELSGQFNAFVSLPCEIKLEYQFMVPAQKRLKVENPCAQDQMNHITVKYLPPIELSFTLPPDYPSTSPPRFTLICSWLGRKQLSKLCEKLDQLWDENKGLEILYLWLSFLKEESFSFLELGSTINLSKQYSFNLLQIEKWKKYQNMKVNPTSSDSCEASKTISEPPGSSPGPSQVPSSSVKMPDKYSVSKAGTSLGTPSIGRGRGRGRGMGRGRWRGKENQSHPGGNIPKSSASSRNTNSQSSSSTQPHLQCPRNSQNLPNPRHQSQRPLDVRAVSCDTLHTPLISHILECNKNQHEKEFQRNIYTCQICFDDKPGSQCIEFSGCGHIFCRECVGSYFEVMIKDGNVRSLMCPENGCKSEALHSQVSDLVSPELFARYDGLLLSTTLDEMEDIVYCPRKTCQYPVTYESGETMARCVHCSYTFCTLCRMTYHGVEKCRMKSESGLIAEYEGASEERKVFLEKKYGRRTIQDLLDTCYSEQWIKGNSKNCPHCQVSIEKTDGCNKMTCWKCNTFFCWLCLTRLNPSCPYDHFNSLTSPCLNQLFYGVVAEHEVDLDSEDDDDDNHLLEY